jgi:6-phosphogluconolactonase
MSGGPEIRILKDLDEVGREASEFFAWVVGQAISARGSSRVALSGGSTPKTLFTALTNPASARTIRWSQVEFYFGDERCVPPEHPESNFGLANQALFKPLNITPAQIVRIEGEQTRPEEAARRYEEQIRQRFSVGSPAVPRFDLILLGLGDDGHTASLFPDTPALREETRLVVPNQAPRGVRDRITFTAPLINRADTILFMVSGGGKAEAVRAVLEEKDQRVERYPARLIRSVSGRVVWFLDQEAASKLRLITQAGDSNEE